jgi:hypothetical protein
MKTQHRELGTFSILLGSLVIFMLVIPIFPGQEGASPTFLRLSISAVLLAGVWVASERRWQLIVACGLALPTLAVQWFTHFFPGHSGALLNLSMTSGFLFFTAGVQLTALLRERLVTTDTVLGGINVYLLLAFAFMMIHALIETAAPGSYLAGGTSLYEYVSRPQSGTAFETVLYFSFTTLTTLGYGDIVPKSGMARTISSLEAVVGQLYVAILIGRLVALQITHSSKRED